jgi:signal transduction histidine kinase
MTELKSAGVFVELLNAELQPLKGSAKTARFNAGEIVFEQGDPGDGIYVIESGAVEISALIPGQERRVLSVFGPASFFGEMAVLDEQPRSATARAVGETVLSFIPSQEMWRALEHSPQLLLSLVREFSVRMRQTDRRYLEEVIQAERFMLIGRFAQSIVHDFKNPLNMIGFAADVAAGESASPEMRDEAKETIRKQVNRLANMINELLEFTRGSTGNITPLPVDYGAFIREALEEIRPEAQERNVQLECENEAPQIFLPLDATRLLHVFYNLIHNAIDVMPDGGKIVLRFTLDDSVVTTEIEDSGPGIAPEMASRLFEPFATHGKTHGTGLGLSICKRIIDDHRGQILARNEPGRGAVFSFSLPRNGAAQATETTT